MQYPTADPGWFSPSLTSPELVWRVGLDWTLLSINRSYHQYSVSDLKADGYTLLRRLLSQPDVQVLDDAILAASRRGAVVPVVETRSENPASGERVHFLTSLSPVFDHGRMVAVEGTTRDVTLLRVVEGARERRLSELAALSYMTSRLGSARNRADVLHQVLQSTLDVLGGVVGSIRIRVRGRLMMSFSRSAELASRALCDWAARSTFDSRECLRVVAPPPVLMDAAHYLDIGSVAVLPLRIQGKPVGEMAVACPAAVAALKDHHEELVFAASQLVETFDNAAHRAAGGRRHRDHILAAFTRTFSHGRLLILTASELLARQEKVSSSMAQSSAPIVLADSLALPRVRRLIEHVAVRAGCNEDLVADLALCATEAATNVLVHGAEGTLIVHRLPQAIQVWIQDRGQGIDLVALARSALLRSYSTKASMGLGFNVMLELADTVSVHTSPRGTTLILECRIRETAPAWSGDAQQTA